MPSTSLVHAIREVGYGLMLVEAAVTHDTKMEIIKEIGKQLTISIPDGLLPVLLIVDPQERRD
jgi:hypothetical protein